MKPAHYFAAAAILVFAALTASFSNAATLYEQPVTLNFTIFPGDSWQGRAVGDINDDGRDDVIFSRSQFSSAPGATNTTKSKMAIRANTSGGFVDISDSIFTVVPEFFPVTNAIVIADFNGDNRNDLFVGTMGPDFEPFLGAQARLFLKNATTGKLDEVTSTNLPLHSSPAIMASAADFDKDGDQDIYVSGWGSGGSNPHMFFLINNGSGVFTLDQSRLPFGMRNNGTGQSGHRNHIVFDADFDGDIDIQTIQDGSSSNTTTTLPIKTLENDGTGNFPTYAEGGEITGDFRTTRSQAHGDFNKDGTQDGAFGMRRRSVGSTTVNRGGFGVLYGFASGADYELDVWSTTYYNAANTPYPFTMDTAYINNDCYPDIIMDRGGVSGASGRIYENDTTGMLVENSTFPVSGGSNQDLKGTHVIIDIDGDGGNDIYRFRNYYDTTTSQWVTEEKFWKQNMQPNCPVTLNSAVLPYSRSVQTGSAFTFFSLVQNTSSTPATGCQVRIGTPNGGPVTFFYQTTDKATNALTGTQNTPFSIPANDFQTLLIGASSTDALETSEVQFGFSCENGMGTAPTNRGVNTAIVTVSDTPVPDVIAIASTIGTPGVVDLGGNSGQNVFATAGVNIGSAQTLRVRPVTQNPLPLTLFVCEVDGAGTCLSPYAPFVDVTFAANQTKTFSVFVVGQGTNVPADFARNRVRLQFEDVANSANIFGATSVAVIANTP